ncbi:TetR/AcrR family transcriptional regulator [Anoxynatronum buryatiense]|uniref:Transcriptional regulator, TetR family n=1 Tax=Anoxynatronum buryatiense TaxID=489973 RepID=A0AA45WXH5_9CLOT|nr:TetR/AcrR family transcriptional regulator [Anoxynatronum buryatiense]SMP62742.1 transcriptional regulator, TetR family [Anoxynatronum buryatiense]
MNLMNAFIKFDIIGVQLYNQLNRILNKLKYGHFAKGEGNVETKQRLTKRQIQANHTRNRVYKTALELMEIKGLNNTSIEEISKKAGVSVGTFYNYFKSKDDILVDIYRKADDYFLEVVEKELVENGPDTYHQLLIFFRHYAKYTKDRGLDNACQLYSSKNKLFIAKDRYMPKMLIRVIWEGQMSGQIIETMTAEELADFCMIAARGVVFDWCLHDGVFDLEVRIEAYMKKLLQVVLVKDKQ